MNAYLKVLSTIAVTFGACAAMQTASATTIKVTGMEYANPVTATLNLSQLPGQALRESAYTGAFDATVGNVALEAWCVDIFQQTVFGATVTDYTPATAGNILSTLGQSRITALQGLAAEALNQVVDAKTSAAFQLSVWEIVNESGSVYDLSDGNFTVSNVSRTGVQSLAQDWLSKLPATSNYKFDLWTSPTHQDLISFKAAASSVPEPGTVAMMGLGVLGFGLSRRCGSRNRAA